MLSKYDFENYSRQLNKLINFIEDFTQSDDKMLELCVTLDKLNSSDINDQNYLGQILTRAICEDIAKIYLIGGGDLYSERSCPLITVFPCLANSRASQEPAYTIYFDNYSALVSSYVPVIIERIKDSDGSFLLDKIFDLYDKNTEYEYLSIMIEIIESIEKDGIINNQTIEWMKWNCDLMLKHADLFLHIMKPSDVINDEESENASITNCERGYVYILTNPAMPGLVKIGMTIKHPNERVKELSSATGVPLPFVLVYYREFSDCRKAEGEIHALLSNRGLRYNNQREFFKMNTIDAINTLLSIDSEIDRYESMASIAPKEFCTCSLGELKQVFDDAKNKCNNESLTSEERKHYEKTMLDTIKRGYKIGWIDYAHVLSMSRHKIELYEETLLEGIKDDCPLCFIELAKEYLDQWDFAYENKKALRQKAIDCLEMFADEIEKSYIIDPDACFSAIKYYIYACTGLNKKINEHSISPFIRKYCNECVDEDILYLYNFRMNDCGFMFENDELIEFKAQKTFEKILGGKFFGI